MMAAPGLPWRRIWRIARRDLNARLRGLRLLFLCLFLGVGTLAAIGTLSAGITAELAARGQTLLGGDVEVALSQREASPAEKAVLAARGRLSETIRMRAMAQRIGPTTDGGPSAVLSELKGVDGAYPLFGRLTLRGGAAPVPSATTVLIGQALADRLALGVGDSIRFGLADYRIGGVIADEPDRVGEGFTLGPVAITTVDGLRRSGLIQPGSLYVSKYRLRMPANADAAALVDRLDRQYKSAGWEVKGRDRAAPGTNRFFDRMGQFLALIGLAALVIAGIGVSNGVSSYLAGKRGSIATFKVLGASSADILRIYMAQIGAVAALAIAGGLVAGVITPPAIVAALGDVLPVQPGLAIHPIPLISAAAYGLLIAVIFTLPPLARARTQPAAAIFRSGVEWAGGLDRRTIGAVALAIIGVVAIALITAREPLFSAAVLGAVALVLGLLAAIGVGVRTLARRVPRPRRPLLRLALANVHRPGAQTPALVIALGLALTLFVTLAAIQTSLSAEIAKAVPQRAPDQFVLDVPMHAEPQFRAIIARTAPMARVQMVPALRGTITAYGNTRVADLAQLPDGAWFLRGERGVTYADALPPGSDLLAGQWWPRDYAGPPLVSLDQEAADIMGITVGDAITVSVLGREITARIASLRRVNWDSMGFNYILVFSPNSLAAAPHTLAATITQNPAPGQHRVDEGAMSRALLSAFPSVSIIAVGDVIGQVSTLLDQMADAIIAAASITILAGVAVLIGAIAASRQSRSYDSVIMKVLGATRWQVLGAQMMEYALLASVLALVALVLGGVAGWFVITQLFDFGWSPNWWVVAGTLGGGALATLGIGMAGSIPLMALRPAQALRTL
ncbi:MAG: ABC transporter permease [Sphingopyxis sp.]